MATALVTGASSGIGRDIARALSRRGYSLILTARREDRLKALQREFKTPVEIIVQDLGTSTGAAELFDKVKDKKIDIVINNAGFGACGEFVEIPLEKETEMIDLNIKSMHVLMKLFVQQFCERGNGTVLNVASSAAFFPGPLMSTYYASKAYVLRLTLGVAEELRRQQSKVVVCALCPGPVATEFDSRANVKFSMKSLSSEYTAEYGVKNMLKGKKVIIPGVQMKAARFFSRILPETLLARMAYGIQRRKTYK